MTLKDLQKAVQSSQQFEPEQQSQLLQRLRDKPFWIFDTCSFQTDSKEEYERHGAMRHTKNPLLYPTLSEIEQYGIRPQSKEWEV